MLAELVREYRFLYDTHDFFYKDLTKKQNAWKDIGKRMNVSKSRNIELSLCPPGKLKPKTKNKWKFARERYMRMKRTCTGTTGQAATKVQRLDYLSFLDEFCKPRGTFSNIATQHSNPAKKAGSFEQ
ncbi:uncharacterized protein LOC128270451 [Anopheles cruzii]|uniref:uncharacterized protein LOC128270451 n=1 Tax=Anopheles cruzii TaxID=68878 RepID=UPI0022EC6FB6|nr:uncharacterized protein LOC128270451 [Anopheles cruzii]